jgi:hypothetical protein
MCFPYARKIQSPIHEFHVHYVNITTPVPYDLLFSHYIYILFLHSACQVSRPFCSAWVFPESPSSPKPSVTFCGMLIPLWWSVVSPASTHKLNDNLAGCARLLIQHVHSYVSHLETNSFIRDPKTHAGVTDFWSFWKSSSANRKLWTCLYGRL